MNLDIDFTVVTKSLVSLYTSAESNTEDRVLGEVQNDSFITLPDKGRHTGFLSPKTVSLYPRGIDEGFYNSDSTVGSLIRLGCEQCL